MGINGRASMQPCAHCAISQDRRGAGGGLDRGRRARQPAGVMAGFSFYGPDDDTFHTTLGYRITEWSYGAAQLTMDVLPRHLGGGGFVHGGVLMGLVDIAALYAGNYVDGRRRPLVTISLATSFLAPAYCTRLVADGRLQRAEDRIFYAEATVRDPDSGRDLASGQGSFRYLAPPEQATDAPRYPAA